MKKYNVFIDLDGTLLLDWNNHNTDAVNFLMDNKDLLNIYINTGRPPRFAKPMYDLLELDTPMSSYNGGYCFNPQDESFPIYDNRMPNSIITNIIRKYSDNIKFAYTEVNDKVYCYKVSSKYNEFIAGGDIVTGDFFETFKEDSHSCILIVKDEIVDEFLEDINTNYTLNARSWGAEYRNIIELFSDNINKGKSSEHIVNSLGLEHDTTICFGDELNDIQMLKYVKYGVAMGNAKEERLGKHAVYQTLKNTENGISQFLKDFLNGDIKKYIK